MNARRGLGEVLFEGQWLRLRRHRDWEFIEHRHARGIAVIIAVTKDQRLLLVEQERIPVGRRVIELPAGLIGDREARHAAESFDDAARRELWEETGYRAGRMIPLMQVPFSAARSPDLYSFFRAENLEREHSGGGVESERIIVHLPALDTIHEWLRERAADGALIDPKIFIGLHLLAHPSAAIGFPPLAQRANRG